MNLEGIKAAATSIRSLSMDQVQSANSGHPGLPMGCAELGALLYGDVLKHNPKEPKWLDRDRFVLSAGHGSAFIYSLLHLSGYKLPLDELKRFRQMGSLTPGHPELNHTEGVETTTGPLGAGFSNAVGMAIAETFLADKFNTKDAAVIDHYTYSLSGDGCMMEGLTSESASLAGHLGLGKLIVFYDSNKITIEGSTELAFTENVKMRFQAYNWQTLEGDMHNPQDIQNLINKAKEETAKPTLIILNSIIGKGSPNKEGTAGIHGAPLGDDEIALARKNLGIPVDESFYIHPEAVSFFNDKKEQAVIDFKKWSELFRIWSKNNPDLRKEWDLFFADAIDLSNVEWPEFKEGDSAATRKISGAAIKAITVAVPNLIGGSADLAPSNNTAMDFGDYGPSKRGGRTLHFGVREHAMGGIANGITTHGGLRTFCATFMVFADYMRPTIRLAALMNLPTIFILTHDSVFVGEDGPTHQPVEHLASLRIIPGLTVLRPADAEETVESWKMAVENTTGPTVLALTRQNLSVFSKSDSKWKETIRKGAYVASDSGGTPDVVVVATGSEVNLALDAAMASDKNVRVVSMVSRETFQKQDSDFRTSLIPSGVKTVVVEAGVRSGWEGIATSAEDILSIDTFGISAPAKEIKKHFGLTIENLIRIIG
ncbi:MAG: transketolase [Spirochaetia bacterium]|jgi:transketolase|nr:transketolase [Spirochaetia bacterium]